MEELISAVKEMMPGVAALLKDPALEEIVDAAADLNIRAYQRFTDAGIAPELAVQLVLGLRNSAMNNYREAKKS